MIKISDWQCGQRYRLVDFGDSPSAYKRRLMSLGLTRGTEVEVIRFAPLGCPVQVMVRHTTITLRLNEAQALCWERV